MSSLALIVAVLLRLLFKGARRQRVGILCVVLIILAISTSSIVVLKIGEIIENEQAIEIHGNCEVKSIRDMFWEHVKKHHERVSKGIKDVLPLLVWRGIKEFDWVEGGCLDKEDRDDIAC